MDNKLQVQILATIDKLSTSSVLGTPALPKMGL